MRQVCKFSQPTCHEPLVREEHKAKPWALKPVARSDSQPAVFQWHLLDLLPTSEVSTNLHTSTPLKTDLGTFSSWRKLFCKMLMMPLEEVSGEKMMVRKKAINPSIPAISDHLTQQLFFNQLPVVKELKKPFWGWVFRGSFLAARKKQRFIKNFQQLGIDMNSFFSDDVGCFFGLLIAASPLASESLSPNNQTFWSTCDFSDKSKEYPSGKPQDASPWLEGEMHLRFPGSKRSKG